MTDKSKTTAASSATPVATPIVKDLSLVNLVENYRGDGPVSAFFRRIDDAAALGNWSEEDKIRIVAIKLRGPASLYYNSNPDFRKPDLRYEELVNLFLDRFKIKKLDQYNYTALQNVRPVSYTHLDVYKRQE